MTRAPYSVPAQLTLLAEVNRRWPNRSRASDGWIGDAAHQTRKSNHNPEADGSVDARDYTVAGIDVGAFLAAVVGDPRVTEVIYDAQWCGPSTGWKWRTYNGANPHRTHIHVTVSDARQNDTGPWGLWPLPAAPAPAPTREEFVIMATREDVAGVVAEQLAPVLAQLRDLTPTYYKIAGTDLAYRDLGAGRRWVTRAQYEADPGPVVSLDEHDPFWQLPLVGSPLVTGELYHLPGRPEAYALDQGDVPWQAVYVDQAAHERMGRPPIKQVTDGSLIAALIREVQS